MLNNLNQPKGSTIGVLRDGRTIQEALYSVVTPAQFGVYPQEMVASGENMRDDQPKLQEMLNYAAANNLIVDFGVATVPTVAGRPRKVFYIKSPLDFTGVTSVRGQLFLACDSRFFTDTRGFGFAVLKLDATFNNAVITANSTSGDNLYDWIELRNIYNDRTTSLEGILWIASRTVVQKLRATRFNGRGIWFGQAYDSFVSRVEVEWCGHKDKYGMDCVSYTPSDKFDESNGLTIGSLLIHNCYDRAWRVAGSKCVVLNVHEEGTLCNELPTTQSAADRRSPTGYVTSYFSSIGGSLGNVSVDHDRSSTNKHVMAVGNTGTHTGNLYTSSAVAVLTGDPAPNGGFIGQIRAVDLYLTDLARTRIGNVTITGTVFSSTLRSNDCVILGGNIAELSGSNANMSNVTFSKKINLTGSIISTYRDCTFNAGVSSLGSGAVLDNCDIAVEYTTSPNERITFRGSRFAEGLTLSGTGLNVSITGCRVAGRLTLDESAAGVWELYNNRVGVSVVGWKWPTSGGNYGTKCEAPYVPTAGGPVEKMWNGTSWITTRWVQTAP
jgi:hypothetical protein